MDKDQERAWIKAEIAAQAERKQLLDATHDDIVALLIKARDSIALMLASQPSDYQQWRLTALSMEVDRILGSFADSGGSIIGQSVPAAWSGGIAALDKPMAAAGIDVVLPVIDISQLNAMSAFSVDRIKDVGVQAAAKIKTEIGLALIGAQDISATIDKVGAIMGETSRSRVTTIVGDNLGSAWETASYRRALQSTDVGVEMIKIWRRSGKIHSRLAHDLADGQRQPIDKPFIINGHRIQYPKDPAAPLAEKVNCGCVALYRPADMASTLGDKRPFTAREIQLNPNKAQIAVGKSLSDMRREGSA